MLPEPVGVDLREVRAEADEDLVDPHQALVKGIARGSTFLGPPRLLLGLADQRPVVGEVLESRVAVHGVEAYRVPGTTKAHKINRDRAHGRKNAAEEELGHDRDPGQPPGQLVR